MASASYWLFCQGYLFGLDWLHDRFDAMTATGRQLPPTRPKGGAFMLAKILAQAIDAFNSKAKIPTQDWLRALEYVRYAATESMMDGSRQEQRLSDGPYFKEEA